MVGRSPIKPTSLALPQGCALGASSPVKKFIFCRSAHQVFRTWCNRRNVQLSWTAGDQLPMIESRPSQAQWRFFGWVFYSFCLYLICAVFYGRRHWSVESENHLIHRRVRQNGFCSFVNVLVNRCLLSYGENYPIACGVRELEQFFWVIKILLGDYFSGEMHVWNNLTEYFLWNKFLVFIAGSNCSMQ